MGEQPYIIAIDDMPYNLELLEICLGEIDAEVKCAESGAQALELIYQRHPDLILLDIMMPEMDGYTVCKKLKDDPATKEIPVLFLSAMDSIDDKVKGFEAGGVDYITKPFNTAEVIARVKTHLKLHRMLEEMNTLLRESFHEIYTPLGMIKSSLTLQEIEYGETEHLQNIKSATQSLHSIYEDIYYAIKKEAREYPAEWIDLEEFLRRRILAFKPQMSQKKLQYTIDSKIESPMIRMNITELERLIDNLLSNSIKYALLESTISLSISPTQDMIQLVIANSSKKIKDVKKLFNELYREDHSVMGLGIGLSIVKKICQKYSIEIDVESEDGITRFSLLYKEK